MKDIDNKFDKAEKVVERVGKLALKIVTTLAAIVLGVLYTWNQFKADAPAHVHEDDLEFQEYLMEVETSAGYEGEVDSAYEDSLYIDYYHLEEEMLGWADCMEGKIVSHYGPEVKECVKGVTHSNWEDILKCIVDVKGITNPEVWIPEQLAYFTVWSAECVFENENKEDWQEPTEIYQQQSVEDEIAE